MVDEYYNKYHLKIKIRTREPAKGLAGMIGNPVITLPWECIPDHTFVVSVAQFRDDVVSSVVKEPGGYLTSVMSNGDCLNRYINAAKQIFPPDDGIESSSQS